MQNLKHHMNRMDMMTVLIAAIRALRIAKTH